MPEVNEIAPDFTLVDTTKTPHTLSSYRGKKVVLAFYPAAFTGVCTAEMCSLSGALSQFNDANAVVFGISTDLPFANGGFKQASGIEFPLLSDYKKEVLEAWGLGFDNFAGLPGTRVFTRSVFVLDEQGRVAWKWLAPNPGVAPDVDAIKAALA